MYYYLIMKEIYPNLFIGSQNDYEFNKDLFNDWFVVHACKDPYHRNALGYLGKAAPKASPYYYFIYDSKGHLILNMVDVEDSGFYCDTMIDEALKYCINGLKNCKKVFIHCNQGESRAPSIALLVLRKAGILKGTFAESVIWLRNIYPAYNPKNGIYTYVKNRW